MTAALLTALLLALLFGGLALALRREWDRPILIGAMLGGAFVALIWFAVPVPN